MRADGPRHPLQARRREADGDGRRERRLGARARAHARGLQTFLVERPATRSPSPSLDITRKFARIEFDEHPRRRSSARPATTPRSGGASLDDAAVLLAAELIGVSEAANALALDYAQAREVFGKPLSKFQVTRHKAVDMLREIELAQGRRALRGVGVRRRAPDREIAAAMAKAYTADAANYVTAECIQIHGGVGYTWECDAHVFLRRAKVDDLLLGAQGWQRERVADLYFATL